MRLSIFSLLILLLLIILPTAAFCQTANVNNDLTFGNIFPGIPKTVSKETPGAAAEFLITGTAGAEVTLDFTLPTYMSSGGWNMTLIFRETDCAMDSSASPDQTSPRYDDIDPWHTITYRLGSGGLLIWLGGEVVPRLNQLQGSYTGSIVITVAYTGN